MTFTCFSFFLFLAAVCLIFHLSPDRWRGMVLLVASYGFYASFKAGYLLALLLMVTGISYASVLRIAAHRDEGGRKRWLWIGSIGCLALLAIMKYLPFLEGGANWMFGLNCAFSSTVTTIGVSYFTLQAVSYLADVYLEIEEPERHFGRYALYVAFFPKLLQGPIERAADLLPQLRQEYRFDYESMRSGMLLFTWGLFKKVVVANRFALFADQIYGNVHDFNGLPLILGTYAYAFELYYDFSAYTDMARGAARMFGINLTQNFNSPYLATSVADFWRRWHISFSRWILDYIFKPLQMGWRDMGQAGTALALIVTFLISGIWHGATTGFVVWGLLHGIYLASSTYYRPYQKRLHRWVGVEKTRWLRAWQILVTFNLVCLAWVFFRAKTISDAWYVVGNLLNFSGNYTAIATRGIDGILLGYDKYQFLAVIIFIAVAHKYKNVSITTRPTLYRWVAYNLLIWSIAITGNFGTDSFIYFQF